MRVAVQIKYICFYLLIKSLECSDPVAKDPHVKTSKA